MRIVETANRTNYQKKAIVRDINGSEEIFSERNIIENDDLPLLIVNVTVL